MEVNKIVDDYILLLDKRLDKDVDPWDLSVELEDFVSTEMYDFLKDNRPDILELLADDIYDITEPMEPGMDAEEFYNDLTLFKKKVIDSIN